MVDVGLLFFLGENHFTRFTGEDLGLNFEHNWAQPKSSWAPLISVMSTIQVSCLGHSISLGLLVGICNCNFARFLQMDLIISMYKYFNNQTWNPYTTSQTYGRCIEVNIGVLNHNHRADAIQFSHSKFFHPPPLL